MRLPQFFTHSVALASPTQTWLGNAVAININANSLNTVTCLHQVKKNSSQERYSESLGNEAHYSEGYLYLPIEGRTTATGSPFPNSRTVSSATAFVNVYVFGQSCNTLKSINIPITLIQPKS
jgi:hypothetical protein